MSKQDREKQIGKTIYKSKRIILPIVLLFFVASVFIVIQTVNGRMNASDDKTVIKYENGDYIYKAPEKNIVFDKETNEIYINDVLVVYTLTDLKEKEANTLAKNVDGKIVGKISGSMNVLQIKTDKSKFSDLQEKADMLMNDKNVLYATYDYPLLITDVSADENPWSDNGEVIADKNSDSAPDGNDWWAEAIGAYEAWEKADVNKKIKIGIIDSGFDIHHPELEKNIKLLDGYPGNTGFEHGTLVSGIISADNNNTGIRGIADSLELYAVDRTPDEHTEYISSGEYIAITKQMVEQGINVINNSWAMSYFTKEGYRKYVHGKETNPFAYIIEYLSLPYESYLEYMEIHKKASAAMCISMIMNLMLNGQEDFIIVQGAGNGEDDGAGPGVEVANSCYYCSINEEMYDLLYQKRSKQLEEKGITYETVKDHIMVVGAVENSRDENGNYQMWKCSNYGETIDICAPGKDIFTTSSEKKYAIKNGTSLAAPMVTGSIALLWDSNPEMSAGEIKKLLRNSSTKAVGVGRGKGTTYPMLNIGEAVEAVNRWKNVRNLKEGHYVGENEKCFVSVDVLKDSKDICHLTVNYNTKDFSESKRYDLVWNQEIYNFTQGESNSKAAEISINLNESGLDFAINDSNIAFSMTLEKDDSFNLANTVLAVKEFFAQGNYTNLEYSDKYDYNAGWYTEMWLVSVYEDNKCIYSVWVNNEQFAEPGLATVISGEDMEAIINGQIMMGDMKILEAFSVFDYYDFNPVPGENETADKKKENSSNSSEYMSFDSLAGKCFEYDDGTLLYSIEFLEESGKITANMGTFSSGGKGTCLEMFEVELKNGENSYIVDTFVSGFGVVEENNNITIIPQEDTVHVLWIDSNGKTKVDADFLSVGMDSNEQIELSDYIFDFQYNNSDYGKLVTKLNMEPAQYWQFSDAYSYVADQFYVEWKDGLFSMKNEGFNNVKLYGMQIGDRMNQVIKNLENAGWEYYSFYEDSYTYFSNINERKCMLEVRVDANDNIVYWYINNWPQGDY